MPDNTSTHQLHCPHGQGISSLSNAGKYRCSACQYFHKRFFKKCAIKSFMANGTRVTDTFRFCSDPRFWCVYGLAVTLQKKKKKNGSTFWYVRKFRRRFRGSRTWTGASSVACDLFLHRPQAHTRAQDKAGEGDESSTMTKVGKKEFSKSKRHKDVCQQGWDSCHVWTQREKDVSVPACFLQSNAYILIISQR